MSLSEWSQARDPRVDVAERALKHLPEEEHGVAHPFPLASKWDYKDKHDNSEINERITKAPVMNVPLDQLHGIQRSVKPKMVDLYIKHPDIIPEGAKSPKHGGLIDYPVVIRQDGKLYIHDGHHRATAAFLTGESHIPARIVDFDRDG